jgi:hypothetical protein
MQAKNKAKRLMYAFLFGRSILLICADPDHNPIKGSETMHDILIASMVAIGGNAKEGLLTCISAASEN